MDRPKMDHVREQSSSPLLRQLRRAAPLLKAGAIITLVALAVGSLPVIFLYFWAEDPATQPAPTAFFDGPYLAEELRYDSGEVMLAGRLMLPPGPGPHAALVIAHGSGRATRFDYEWLAARVVARGYALLTYDKRGVGESTGVYTGVGPINGDAVFAQLAADVVAGVRVLGARGDIDPDRIGVLGISQGGWIAPLAAADSSNVAFVAIVSGTTVSVGEEIFYSELTGEREGIDLAMSDAELSEQLSDFDGPRGFDPQAVLNGLAIPALWVLGDADRSIPIPETVAILEQLIGAGKPFHYELLPGVGHAMRDVRTGRQAPAYEIVADWLDGDLRALESARDL